jgi:hypothetical protein
MLKTELELADSVQFDSIFVHATMYFDVNFSTFQTNLLPQV